MRIEEKLRTVGEGLLMGVVILLVYFWLQSVGLLPGGEDQWPNAGPDIDLVPDNGCPYERKIWSGDPSLPF